MAGKRAKDKLPLTQRQNVWRFVFRVNMAVDELIAHSGLSKKELADLLGVSPARISHLSDLERDHRISTLAKILEALGVEYELRLKLNNKQICISPREKDTLRSVTVPRSPMFPASAMKIFPSGKFPGYDDPAREVSRVA